jgi:hypothetical protein
MPKRIFVPKKAKVMGMENNYVMKSYFINPLNSCLLNKQKIQFSAHKMYFWVLYDSVNKQIICLSSMNQ